jgi:hypothetical protein
LQHLFHPQHAAAFSSTHYNGARRPPGALARLLSRPGARRDARRRTRHDDEDRSGGDGGDGEFRGAWRLGLRTVLVERGLPHTELLFERNTCCKLTAVRINRNTYYKLLVRTLSGATIDSQPEVTSAERRVAVFCGYRPWRFCHE